MQKKEKIKKISRKIAYLCLKAEVWSAIFLLTGKFFGMFRNDHTLKCVVFNVPDIKRRIFHRVSKQLSIFAFSLVILFFLLLFVSGAADSSEVEICDGIDNDNNSSTVDGYGEDWFSNPTTCGVGECANTGVLGCSFSSGLDFMTNISNSGSDRGTSYYMSNKIILADDKIFVGWHDRSYVGMLVYDEETKTWGKTVNIGTWWDNHGGPAITIDGDGYLYTIFGAHNTPFRFRKSTNPYNISSWEMETKPDGVSDLLEERIYRNTFVYMAKTELLTDNDGDGIPDILEFILNGNLSQPVINNTDNDGDNVSDALEVKMYGKNTNVDMRVNGILTDSDNDNYPDIIEVILNGNIASSIIINYQIDNDEVLIGASSTYPSLVIDSSDTLHLAYRSQDYGNHLYQHEGGCINGLVYQHKEKGKEWSQLKKLVDVGIPWSYNHWGNHLAISNDGTLHLAFHIYYQTGTGAFVDGFGYIRSRDNGETWTNVNGKIMALPIRPSDTDCFIDVRDQYNFLLRVEDLAVNNDDVFVIVNDINGYVLWHHNGTSWKSKNLKNIIQKTYNYSYPINFRISIGNSSTLYLVSSGALRGSNGIFLLVSNDQGETFQVSFIPTGTSFGAYGVSLEKPFRDKPLEGVPSLIYHTNSLPNTQSDIIFMKLKNPVTQVDSCVPVTLPCDRCPNETCKLVSDCNFDNNCIPTCEYSMMESQSQDNTPGKECKLGIKNGIVMNNNIEYFCDGNGNCVQSGCSIDNDCGDGKYCLAGNCYFNEDVNNDTKIDFVDLVSVAQYIGREDCNVGNKWCERRNVDHSTEVDLSDLVRVARGM